jgi:glycosyltransferase involved in cell wall biosynthesis
MRTLIFGTDLHGKPSEMAAKISKNLAGEIKNFKILSVQNRKPFIKEDNIAIIPKVLNIDIFRKPIQAILLPFYLIFLRLICNRIIVLWTISSRYHGLMLGLMKKLKYEIVFIIISGYDKNYSCLKKCDLIVCQSKRMLGYITRNVRKENVKLIYPGVNLEVFKPLKKNKDILIPSVPYKIRDFEERGIFEIIDFLKNKPDKISATVVFRSQESYEYFKKLNLKNVELINRVLEDKEMAQLMGKSKLIPLIYKKNAPDMPLSAIEGIACGCFILCTDNMGLADLVEEKKVGESLSIDPMALVPQLIEKTIKIGKRKYKEAILRDNFNSNLNAKKYLKI